MWSFICYGFNSNELLGYHLKECTEIMRLNSLEMCHGLTDLQLVNEKSNFFHTSSYQCK